MGDNNKEIPRELTSGEPSETQRLAMAEQMHVRDLNVNEIIIRMNQLRQRGPDGSFGNLTNPFAPRASASAILGTRINFHPEFRTLGLSPPALEAMNLESIPVGCMRNEFSPIQTRPQGSFTYPPINIYGCPAGDGTSNSRFRWLTRPYGTPCLQPRYSQFPRHPFGLGMGNVPRNRPCATRQFFLTEFGVTRTYSPSSSEEESAPHKLKAIEEIEETLAIPEEKQILEETENPEEKNKPEQKNSEEKKLEEKKKPEEKNNPEEKNSEEEKKLEEKNKPEEKNNPEENSEEEKKLEEKKKPEEIINPAEEKNLEEETKLEEKKKSEIKNKETGEKNENPEDEDKKLEAGDEIGTADEIC